MEEEFEICLQHNVIPIPIGATGYVSKSLWDKVTGELQVYYPDNAELYNAIRELGKDNPTKEEIINNTIKAINILQNYNYGKKSIYKFPYVPDNWRASQIRNMGKIEGNGVVTSNKWEEITNGGDKEIEKWIDDNMSGKSCVIIFVGEKQQEENGLTMK